jgi:hypothetical protein
MDGGRTEGRRLITRGNVDGLACAAIVLREYPDSPISFVTSPTAGAAALSSGQEKYVFLADLALVPEMRQAIARWGHDRSLVFIDHHPLPPRAHLPIITAMVEESSSAAGLLHGMLGSAPQMDRMVAMADLIEGGNSTILSKETAVHGRERMEEECRLLDFAWRLDLDDDRFRMRTARELSKGRWPSEIGEIRGRHQAAQETWRRALERVRKSMTVRGDVGILDFSEKRRTLFGFGTRAAVEVAKEKGCHYAVLLQNQRDTASLSVRSWKPDGIHLGAMVENFTMVHGIGGGGHSSSAGARIPCGAAGRFLDELARAVT